MSSKIARRRAWPIHGYVGANGGGKSACMVLDTLPSLEAGRRVLSTVRLLDYRNPRTCEGCEICIVDGVLMLDERGFLPGAPTPHMQSHPLWDPFTRWEQLLEACRVDVLMDEVTGVASSRESQGMPPPVANALVQMRRADVVIRWSAPSWARADKIIRECSQAVTYAVGYLPKAARDEGGSRQWRNRRLARWSTYDATVFEDFTVGKRESMRPMAQQFCWLPRSGVFDAYDSFDSVLTIGTVSEGGSCMRCGGRRSRPTCKCTDNHDHEEQAGSPRSGVQAPRGRRARTSVD